MAFMVKTMVGGQLKNLTGGLGGKEEKGEGEKSAAEAQGMTREEYEEYQKQLLEENEHESLAARKGIVFTVKSPQAVGLRCCTQNRVVDRMERDALYTQRKAERATLRSHFREKYRLPKSETDDAQIQLAGGDVDLPKELAKMIEEDNEEEEGKSSVIGQLTSIQNLDLESIKGKAQSTLDDLKQSAEKCIVM